MSGRWRSLVLIGALMLGLGGVTAFASRHRGDTAATGGSTDPTASAADPAPDPDGSAVVATNGSVTSQAGAEPAAGTTPAGPPTSASTGTSTTSPTTAAAPATSARPATTTGGTTAKPAGGAAALAGRIKPGATYQGVATFYAATGAGACSFDPGADLMVAAMNHTDYETAKACGARVQVRSSSGTTITVRIVDECPECAVGQLDLSREAFTRLADPTLGRIPVSWTLVSPDLGGLSIRYKDGSSRYWCGIQVIDHRNPVARLEVQVNGTFKALTRTSYNYFLSPDGSGCGSAIRITDIYGEALTVPALPVQPSATQKTAVQFSRH